MNRPNQDMQQKRMNQKELYEWIMMLGFCAVDMMLYLDTHPDDEEALNYFNQCTALYNAAKQSYQVWSIECILRAGTFFLGLEYSTDAMGRGNVIYVEL